MSRPCTVCTHASREAIDQALVRGEANRAIARQFGLGAEAVRRHSGTHLRQALGRSLESQRLEITAECLVDWGRSLQLKTLKLLARAEELDDLGNARGLIREARENLGLLGRLAGVLDGPTVHVDARQQLAVLGGMSDDDLRALVAGARALPAGPRVAEVVG